MAWNVLPWPSGPRSRAATSTLYRERSRVPAGAAPLKGAADAGGGGPSARSAPTRNTRTASTRTRPVASRQPRGAGWRRLTDTTSLRRRAGRAGGAGPRFPLRQTPAGDADPGEEPERRPGDVEAEGEDQQLLRVD